MTRLTKTLPKKGKTKRKAALSRSSPSADSRAPTVVAIDERGIISPRQRRIAGPSIDRLSLLAFSDIEDQDHRTVLAWLQASKRKPDFILYAGDGATRFRPEGGPNYFELLARESRFGLGAITGNDEEAKRGRSSIVGERVYELHTKPVSIGPYVIVGLDGAPANRGFLNPHEHSDYAAREHLVRHIRLPFGTDNQIRLLCTHAPPWGMVDKSSYQGHLGWHWLAQEIIRSHPRHPSFPLVICGHVHRRGGKVDSHNGVVVVNVASNSRESDPIRMIWIDLVGNVVNPPTDEDWRFIRPTVPPNLREELPANAWECLDLELIPGIQEARAWVLIDAGIISVYDLANTELSRLRPLRRRLSMGEAEMALLPTRARACLESRPIPLQPFQRSDGDVIYLDIETDLQQSWIWIIGCLDETADEFRQFVARGPSDEHRMLSEFREYAAARPNRGWVSYSNCRLEDRLVGARLTHHGLPSLGASGTIADIYSEIHGAMAFPSMRSQESQGLKGAASSLGFVYRHATMNGYDVGRQAPSDEAESIAKEILEYNEDDVRSLKYVVDELTRRCGSLGEREKQHRKT